MKVKAKHLQITVKKRKKKRRMVDPNQRFHLKNFEATLKPVDLVSLREIIKYNYAKEASQALIDLRKAKEDFEKKDKIAFIASLCVSTVLLMAILLISGTVFHWNSAFLIILITTTILLGLASYFVPSLILAKHPIKKYSDILIRAADFSDEEFQKLYIRKVADNGELLFIDKILYGNLVKATFSSPAIDIDKFNIYSTEHKSNGTISIDIVKPIYDFEYGDVIEPQIDLLEHKILIPPDMKKDYNYVFNINEEELKKYCKVKHAPRKEKERIISLSDHIKECLQST